MTDVSPLLASAPPSPQDDLLRKGFSLDPTTTQGLLVLGVIALLTIFLMIGAYLLYRRQRRQSSHRHSRQHVTSEVSDSDEEQGHRRRRRRRRRPHRPRNPTLSETGGLPPLRRDGGPDIEP